MAIEEFTINVPDPVLVDLARRLDATRWPDELKDVGWEYGSNLAYIKSLAGYWRNGYNWRQQEAALNALPQYRIALDGFHIHFVRVHGKGPAPLPLVITHGWPGSFVEMVKLIPMLTDPVAHDGRAEDAFDVIVPSLPGLWVLRPSARTRHGSQQDCGTVGPPHGRTRVPAFRRSGR
jgi:microsomal epoxide hydrolase